MFRRRQARLSEAPSPARQDRHLAVPLTMEEVQVLVAGLREDDRVMRENFWAHSGSGWAVGEMTTVLTTMGLAAALGHQSVPYPVQALGIYEHVLAGMRQNRADKAIADALELLVAKMHVMTGMARQLGWYVMPTPDGWRWVEQPHPDAVARAALRRAR
jgi:hypothetical protein